MRAFEDIVMEHSHDAAMILHPLDGVVYASPALAHVTGIPSSTFLGMQAADWVHPDDVSIVIEQRRLAGAAGHSGPVTIRGRHADGAHRPFEAEWWHLATDHTVIHLRALRSPASRTLSAISSDLDSVATGTLPVAVVDWPLDDGTTVRLRVTLD